MQQQSAFYQFPLFVCGDHNLFLLLLPSRMHALLLFRRPLVVLTGAAHARNCVNRAAKNDANQSVVADHAKRGRLRPLRHWHRQQ
jgi:hypothetical protein